MEPQDLLCAESDNTCRAYHDPVFNDDRVLRSLLEMEDRYIPHSSYFLFQTDVQPYMRKIVANWMLDVCEERHCREEVFPLAMNYMDRFLSVVQLQKTQLQLLGAVCLFISSKLLDSDTDSQLTAEYLVICTDNSVTLEELMAWELLVLAKLKWDLCAVTASPFLERLLERLHVEMPFINVEKIRRHSTAFISLCCTESHFIASPPSMIAAACIGAAVQGIARKESNYSCSRSVLDSLLERLHQLTSIELDCLVQRVEEIEELISRAQGGESGDVNCAAHRVPFDKHVEQLTPTDVEDIKEFLDDY